MIIVCGSPRNKMWIVWRKPKISPPTWKLFCCVLPQQQNYSAVSSPNSRTLLLCPPPSHQKPKRNSEISELFFLKLFLVPFAQKNQKCHPQLQQSWVESSVLPQQQNYFAVPFPNSKIFLLSSPLPFTTKKNKTSEISDLFWIWGAGAGHNRIILLWLSPRAELFCCWFCCVFSQPFRNQWFFLSRIGSFPLKMKTKYSTPNNKIILLLGEAGVEVSWGSRRPPPIQMPSIESTSTSMVCWWFCCAFSQPFRNQWFIFYPELVLFPLRWKPKIPTPTATARKSKCRHFAEKRTNFRKK